MAITAAVQAIGWLLGGAILAGQATTPPPAGTATAGPTPAVQPAPAGEDRALPAPRTASALADATLTDRAQVEAAGLTVYWQRSLPLDKGDQLVRIDRIEENLYLLTRQGKVVTLDSATGVFRWVAGVADEDIRVLGPTHGPELVYFGTVLGVQGFDRVNGDAKLQWKGKVAPSSPIASDAENLYFGTADSRVVCLRRRDMLMAWQFGSEGLVTSEPLLIGPNLYVVSHSGAIFAAQKKDKVRLWQARVGPVRGDATAWGSHLYVASMDQSLWCFDLVSGRMLWRTRMSFPLPQGPNALAQHVYLPTPEHGVFSINPDTGRIDWTCEQAATFLAEAGRFAWLAGRGAELLACDKATGQVRHQVPSSATLYVSNVDDDAIWMADAGGQVVCLRPAGAGFLRHRKAYEAVGRATLPTTQPAGQPAGEQLVPNPPPPPPTDYLRRSGEIPPLGGNAAASQPDGGQ